MFDEVFILITLAIIVGFYLLIKLLIKLLRKWENKP